MTKEPPVRTLYPMELVYLSQDEWLEDANTFDTAEKLLDFLEGNYFVVLLTQAIDYQAVMDQDMEDYCLELLSHAFKGHIFRFDRTFAAYAVALDKSRPLEPLCPDFIPNLANFPYEDEMFMSSQIAKIIVDRNPEIYKK